MNMLVKKLRPESIAPAFAHPDDAGMDLFSAEDITLEPMERRAVATGIAVAIPEGCVGLVWDKSGRALHDGITTLAGVIDSGYRGEIHVVLLNCSKNSVVMKRAEKIAQLLLQPVVRPEIVMQKELPRTAREDGGFGSTGIHH